MSIVPATMTVEEARKVTMRIKLTAGIVRENLPKLYELVTEAREGEAWRVLGYKSWTAYLSEALGDEPMRLTREQRQEAVGFLAGEGMSSRGIEGVIDASRPTILKDIRDSQVVKSLPPDDEPESPITRVVTGLDGKTYSPVVNIKTKDTHEVTETFDAMTGEAVDSPSPVAASRFLEVDQTFEDQKYVTSFVKAMPVAWTEFDPERIGRVADLDTLQQIDMSLASLTRWVETVKRSRPGLRAL